MYSAIHESKYALILTSNGLGCNGASNGVDPNRSWLPLVVPLAWPLVERRGTAAFGGGATVEKYDKFRHQKIMFHKKMRISPYIVVVGYCH